MLSIHTINIYREIATNLFGFVFQFVEFPYSYHKIGLENSWNCKKINYTSSVKRSARTTHIQIYIYISYIKFRCFKRLHKNRKFQYWFDQETEGKKAAVFFGFQKVGMLSYIFVIMLVDFFFSWMIQWLNCLLKFADETFSFSFWSIE